MKQTETISIAFFKGWTIHCEGDVIIVQHPDVGGCVVQKEPDCDRMIPEAILWALASDMLQQAAPAADSGDWTTQTR